MELRALLRDLVLLTAASTVLAAVNLGMRDRETLPWLATPPPPEAATCGGEDPQEIHLVQRLPVEEVQAMLDRPDVTIVDARSSHEYAQGHLPGAMSLPAESAEEMLGVQTLPIPPNDTIVTYCDGSACERSESLGLLLRAQVGCEKVFVLEGGFGSWVAAGGSVEREPLPEAHDEPEREHG